MGDFKHDMDRFVKTDLTGGFDDSPHGSTPFGRRKVTKNNKSQNEAHEVRQRRAREIAEYRISIMEDEQKAKLSLEVLKYRRMVFMLMMLGFVVGAIALIPLGAWLLTQVEEDGSIFSEVILIMAGFGCLVGAIYTISKRIKTKNNPVQYAEMVAREAAHVLNEYKNDLALLTERNRVADVIRQGINEKEEKRLQALREQEEEINAKVRAELESHLSDIKRIADEFNEPTIKLLNTIATYGNLSQNDIIDLFNDVITIYHVRYGAFCFLRRQILNDCPQYKYKSPEGSMHYTENRIRLIKAYFGELKTRVDPLFPENEHAAVCAMYCIVRTNYIKNLAREYRQRVNADSLDEYCAVLKGNAESSSYLVRYICYTIEDDIFSDRGIFADYDSLQEKIKEIINRQMDEQTHRALFEGKPVTSIVQTSVHKDASISLEDKIDSMTGLDFEKFVGGIFRKMGYKTEVTKGSGDFGIDVIADNGIVRIGIQAKCYSGSVGNEAVQQAVAGRTYYKLDKAMVVTNNYFTPAAIQQARASMVTLWNRDDLIKECKELGIDCK